LQWVLMIVPATLEVPIMMQFFALMIGILVGTLGVFGWWLFASRVPWRDRLLGIGAFVAVGAIAYCFLLDQSFDVFALMLLVLPFLTTAVVAALLVTFFLSWPVRRLVALGALALTWAFFASVRYEGVTGEFAYVLPFRWGQDAEAKYRA